MFIRSDMADIQVFVDGVQYGDSWAEAEGGNLAAENAKVRPGGMGPEQSAGGWVSRDDLTVRIPFSDLVAVWHPTFEASLGNADVTVALHWLGRNKKPTGLSITRKGTSQAANLPTSSASSTEVAMYELVVSCNEAAT